jgi:hypothetical protein
MSEPHARKFCTNCGTPISLSSLYCSSCGQQTSVEFSRERIVVEPSEAHQVQKENVQAAPNKASTKTKVILTLAISIPLLAVVAIEALTPSPDVSICKEEINEAYADFFVARLEPQSIRNQPYFNIDSALSDMIDRAESEDLRIALRADKTLISDRDADRPNLTWAYCQKYFRN